MNLNQAFAELCFENQRYVIKKAIRNSFQFQQNKKKTFRLLRKPFDCYLPGRYYI